MTLLHSYRLSRPSGLLGPRPAKRPCRWHRPLPPIAVASQEEVGTSNGAPSDDYYSLLGVSPMADGSQIKKAYRALMREYHPDTSADEDTHEFAIFLNEVYETLMDPDRRALYDSIAGFTPDAINPFLDTTYERDLVFVDEFTCIGCRNCNNVCSKTFGMEDEYGRARVFNQGADTEDKLQEAIDTCPVSCIHWVSAPQLALLEEQMAKMERVAAWLLMSQGGGGKSGNMSVFAEAALAWEKRQMVIRQRMDNAKRQTWEPAWGAWAQSSYDEQQQAQQGAGAGGEGGDANGAGGRGKRVNAASVAAAARKWRDFQRRRRSKGLESRLLTATATTSSADEA